jgi:hypothetical protein
MRVSTTSRTVVPARPADARVGTLRISSPIELKVLEQSKVLGSVPGPDLRLAPGRHDIELVNAAVGYRLRQAIDVEAGQSISIHLAQPHAAVTIDAAPWADVWIDGQPVGRTPLGPLPLALGEHEITFKHPAGTKDRQKVVVKSDASLRVVGVLR